jgi:hypothetical protein
MTCRLLPGFLHELFIQRLDRAAACVHAPALPVQHTALRLRLPAAMQ